MKRLFTLFLLATFCLPLTVVAQDEAATPTEDSQPAAAVEQDIDTQDSASDAIVDGDPVPMESGVVPVESGQMPIESAVMPMNSIVGGCGCGAAAPPVTYNLPMLSAPTVTAAPVVSSCCQPSCGTPCPQVSCCQSQRVTQCCSSKRVRTKRVRVRRCQPRRCRCR